MSALIFILCVEILAQDIRQSLALPGLSIGNTVIKISQYADDAVLFLNNELELANLSISLEQCLE